ncbi:hypothetical protein ZIOFF_039656 [Zingiber officinale]|uniref:Uncharacterized protein n=1 Tax=Zingiber officinale TaxID=94328 RepID=A0A8J5L0B9_ZINOF|nr:hypothetical protein ZIOFF_039656 [Zingiber officinale]
MMIWTKKMTWKSTDGKAPRKSALTTGSMKKPHCFCPDTTYRCYNSIQPMKLNIDNSLHQHASMPQLARSHREKIHVLVKARIGNASNDIHNIAMPEDELSNDLFNDGMQAEEKRRRLNMEQVRALERSFENNSIVRKCADLGSQGRETTLDVINLNKETECSCSNWSQNTSESEQYYKC